MSSRSISIRENGGIFAVSLKLTHARQTPLGDLFQRTDGADTEVVVTQVRCAAGEYLVVAAAGCERSAHTEPETDI